MLDLILDLFRDIYESRDESKVRDPAIRAYESAWRTRQGTDGTQAEVLLSAIAAEGMQDLRAPYSPDVQAALDAWHAGLPPREARKAIREAAEH